MKRILKILNFELIFFIGGLIYLAIINPFNFNHLHFCIFGLCGIDFCPGCGLGRSISFLLHGCLLESICEHPLGTIGLALILNRIYIIAMTHKYLIIYYLQNPLNPPLKNGENRIHGFFPLFQRGIKGVLVFLKIINNIVVIYYNKI